MSKYVVPFTCDLLRPQDGADEERWQLSVGSIEDDEGHGVIDVYITGTDSIKIPWQDDGLRQLARRSGRGPVPA